MDVESLLKNPRFLDFVHTVANEVQRAQPDAGQGIASLKSEQNRLEADCRGWLKSLSDETIGADLRAALQDSFAGARQQIDRISCEIDRLNGHATTLESELSPQVVAERLMSLAEIMAGKNASAMNIMLSQHVQGIYCDPHGRVRIRCCKLGALCGVRDLVPSSTSSHVATDGAADEQIYRAVPRRRGPLDSKDAFEDDELAASLNDFAVNPKRFDGLGDEWFTEDLFQYERRAPWFQEYAREVAEYRLQSGAAMEDTAKHFAKSIPTIRAALNYARRELGVDALGTIISAARRPSWIRDNAAAVWEFFQNEGATTKAAVAHFGKSEPTIRAARKLAESRIENCGVPSAPHVSQEADEAA